MERSSFDLELASYLGSWDIGGRLQVLHNDGEIFLRTATRFNPGVPFFYFLVLIIVPGIGAFTSAGLYALVDAFRESEPILTVLASYPKLLVALICYAMFLVLYPVWALFYRGAPAVRFSPPTGEIVLGRYRGFKKRAEKRRIPFSDVREFEILHTYQYYRGGSSVPNSEDKPENMKQTYFFSIIVDPDEAIYIVRVPSPEPISSQVTEIARACGFPVTYEVFPPRFKRYE